MSLNLYLRSVTALLLGSSLAAACADRPGSPEAELVGPTMAKGGPPGTRGEPYSATFRDDLSDVLFSDGAGAYAAIIMTNGNFKLDVRDTPRELCSDTPWTDLYCTERVYITTSDADVPGGFPAIDPGASMTTNLLTYWLGDDGFQYFLRYGKDCDVNQVAEHRASVERSVDGSTWLISGATGILCKVTTKGRTVTEQIGPGNLPFLITVTAP